MRVGDPIWSNRDKRFFLPNIILVVFGASEENDVEMSSFFRCCGVNGQTQFNPSTPSL